MSLSFLFLILASFHVKGGEPSSSPTASPSTPFSQITQQNSNFEAYGTTLITTRSEPQNDLSAKFQQQKDESALRKRSDREIEDSQKSTNPRLSSSKPLLPRVQQESVLLNHLLKNYDRHVRPLYNASNKMTIKVGITLTQIFDMDEKNQVMTTNVWLDQEWVDEMLIWNPKDYYNITKIRIPCDRIWLPDIVLYNNADDFSTEYMRSLALVEHNGLVFWPPPTKFRSTCPVDVAFFPFDDQICMLKLGSWIHDGFSVDVTNRTFEVDLSNYLPNGEWTLLEKPKLVRSERYYPCCIEPFPEITISLRMRRKTLYYMYNIVFPCMMMSTLTVLVFCLPPDSGEKIALGVTVLLAFSVFMLAIAEKMPETSESIPLIGIYLTTVMAITSVSVVMTVIVLNFFYRGPTVTPVPVWAQIYILRKSRATVIRSKYTKESTINSNYLLTSSGKKLKDPSEHEDLNIRHDESAAIIINNEPEEQTFEGSLNFKLNSSKKKNGALPRSPLAFVNSNNEEDRDYIESSSPEKELNRNHLSSESLSNSDLTRRHSSLNSRRSSHKASNNNNNNFLPKPSTTTTGGSTRNSLLIGGPLSQSKDVYKMDKMMDFMSEKQRDDAMIQEILKDWKMLAQQIDFFSLLDIPCDYVFL
ncbi:neuronal acetylcholine receptor subunit alpha-2 [Lepeophtheirus salmonis]|uniref:neuronal acetylcholine receptor subunit alpha-2 n=1 Tax=Lepeophtheirus salmonis TaxID=72036 RepID=UPI003AF399FA